MSSSGKKRRDSEASTLLTSPKGSKKSKATPVTPAIAEPSSSSAQFTEHLSRLEDEFSRRTSELFNVIYQLRDENKRQADHIVTLTKGQTTLAQGQIESVRDRDR
jgi:hypothetical protein